MWYYYFNRLKVLILWKADNLNWMATIGSEKKKPQMQGFDYNLWGNNRQNIGQPHHNQHSGHGFFNILKLYLVFFIFFIFLYFFCIFCILICNYKILFRKQLILRKMKK